MFNALLEKHKIDEEDDSRLANATENPEDGLHYCNTCNEQKTCKVVLESNSRTYIMPCTCSCDTKRMDEEKRQQKAKECVDRIPALYRNVYLKDLTDPMEYANLYVQNFKDYFLPNAKGLYVYGDKGIGKTYSAQAIINEIALQGFKVFALSFTKLLSIYCVFQNHEEIYQTECKLKHSDLIFLDDFGAFRDTEYSVEKVNEIIDFIYKLKKPVILTSNLSRRHLAENIDKNLGRAYDRIFELTHPVQLKGESYRVKRALEDKDIINKILGL